MCWHNLCFVIYVLCFYHLESRIQHLVSYFFFLLTIYWSDSFLFLVLYPKVGFPHGVTGCLPEEDFPSPPP